MSWGRGFNKSHPCSEQETPEGEEKVPAPRHTLPFKTELLGNPEVVFCRD